MRTIGPKHEGSVGAEVEGELTQGLYLYAIIPSTHPAPVQASGVGEDAPAVRAVRHRELAAAVSPVVSAVRGKRRDLLAHGAVVDELFATGPVLPMRFGIVIPGEQELIRHVLDAGHEQFVDRLGYLADQAELSVRVLHREEVILREILVESPTIRRLREQTSRPGAGYGQQLRLGEAVAAAVEAKQTADAGKVLRRLQRHTTEWRQGSPVEGAVLAGSFLVHSFRLGDFQSALDDLAHGNGERLDIHCVGPLPPYSFAAGAETFAGPPPGVARGGAHWSES